MSWELLILHYKLDIFFVHLQILKNKEVIMTIARLLVIIVLSLAVLTVLVYYLFLKHRIKNKKAMLSFLSSTYKIVFYTVLYCFFINFIVMIIADVMAIEILKTRTVSYLFFAYCIFLIIPRILIFCLQISVEREESGEKVNFCKGLKLFWTNTKKMKSSR